MKRLIGVFVAGSLVGYAYGYEQGDAGEPSLKQRALEKVGVYKVKEDHERRQRALEEIQRERADSIESDIHGSNAPR
jgi:hypothetical protein